VHASVAGKAGLEGDRSADALVRLLYSWKAAKPATTMETSLLVMQTNPPPVNTTSRAGYLFVIESAWLWSGKGKWLAACDLKPTGHVLATEARNRTEKEKTYLKKEVHCIRLITCRAPFPSNAVARFKQAWHCVLVWSW